jgi:pimeloyl-ACP methyl ester carboxylesterase
MQRQMERVDESDREMIDNNRLNPARNPRLSPEVREALEADIALHSPIGFARTGMHTLPYCSVRSRIPENAVPTLLTVGEHEKGFHDNWRWVEEHMPNLEVAVLNAGHGVNLDDAEGFNGALRSFLGRFAEAE